MGARLFLSERHERRDDGRAAFQGRVAQDHAGIFHRHDRRVGREPMKAEKKSGARRKAFSLLEVMIASALFFMAVFAILGLVSSSLNNLRRLQRPLVDASALASELSLTNKLTEGTESGNLSDLLGKDYNAYTWTREIVEVQSNKLF